jgi:hypothetical protein
MYLYQRYIEDSRKKKNRIRNDSGGILMKTERVSLAMAFASIVFPVPGGPYLWGVTSTIPVRALLPVIAKSARYVQEDTLGHREEFTAAEELRSLQR